MVKKKATLAEVLEELQRGDPSAADRLLPLLYDELRALAGRHFSAQPAGHTLQPTALVHEAYLKLAKPGARWQGRAHFLAVAATAMRQVLVDHAREKATAKRGRDWQRMTLDESVADGNAGEREIDLIDLHAALSRLANLNERQVRIVELRIFGGLTIEETAHALGIGTTTVEDEWRLARAWLGREMRNDG